MRVVLDTNALVAGLLSATGPPAWIVEAILAGVFEPVVNSAIRDEYKMCCAAPNSGFQPRWSTSFFQRWINSRSTLRLRLRGPSSFPIPMTNHSFRLPQQRRAYS